MAAAARRWESPHKPLDSQGGDGDAQRLLRRGRHVAAAVEVEGGESCDAAQCLQAFVSHVVAVADVEGRERGEAAAQCAQHLDRHAGDAPQVEGGKGGEVAHSALDFPRPSSTLLLLYHSAQPVARHVGAVQEVEVLRLTYKQNPRSHARRVAEKCLARVPAAGSPKTGCVDAKGSCMHDAHSP
jgi:hypothetical protein